MLISKSWKTLSNKYLQVSSRASLSRSLPPFWPTSSRFWSRNSEKSDTLSHLTFCSRRRRRAQIEFQLFSSFFLFRENLFTQRAEKSFGFFHWKLIQFMKRISWLKIIVATARQSTSQQAQAQPLSIILNCNPFSAHQIN